MKIPVTQGSSSVSNKGQVTAKLTKLASRLKLALSVQNESEILTFHSDKTEGIGDLLDQFIACDRSDVFKGRNFRDTCSLLSYGVLDGIS